MPYKSDPKPDQPQLTGNEQRQIIRAALQVLHPNIFEIRPDREDALTIADYFEIAIGDSTDGSNGVRTIPDLFHDMSVAALGKLQEIAANRANGIPT